MPCRGPESWCRAGDRRAPASTAVDRVARSPAVSMPATVSAMQLRLATSPRFVHADASETALALRDAALLAWLALEGPTPRTRLAMLLWPRSAPEVAGNSLRQRLFQLKRQLGIELVSGHATLALAAGLQHDLVDSLQVLGEAGDELGPELAAWLAQQREQHSRR